MKMKIQGILVLTLATTLMALVGCDHYVCNSGAQFGNTTCNSSGSGLGGSSTSTSAAAYAFAVDTNGTIDGYTLTTTSFGPTSNYTAPTITSPNEGGSGMVTAQGKYAYAVFADLEQIYGWTIDGTGNLAPITGMPLSVSITTPNAFNVGYNDYAVTTDPAGTFLFVSSTDQILVYQIGTTGGLTPAPGSPFTTSINPQNMTTDGQGKFLYATQFSSIHSGSMIEAFSISSSGALQEISTYNFPLWEVQGEPSGKYLLGISGNTASISGSDDPTIHVYSINSSTGALTEVSGSPFTTTYSPFNMAVQPKASSGALIYTFSINDAGNGDNPVEGYQIDTTSGTLSALSGSPFTGAGVAAWGGFDPSGTYLFFYSEQSFDSYSVASNGAITEIEPTGLVTGGYWAIADAQ